VAVIVGGLDGFGVQWGQDNANTFGVPLHVLPNCGHVSFEDNPGLFSKTIKQALSDMMSGDPHRWKLPPSNPPTPAPAGESA
jgi:hypothetical protein